MVKNRIVCIKGILLMSFLLSGISCSKWESTRDNPVGKKVYEAIEAFKPDIKYYKAYKFIDIESLPKRDPARWIELNIKDTKGSVVLSWNIPHDSCIVLKHSLSDNNEGKVFGPDQEDIVRIKFFDTNGNVLGKPCQLMPFNIKQISGEYNEKNNKAGYIEYVSDFAIMDYNAGNDSKLIYRPFKEESYYPSVLRQIETVKLPQGVRRIDMEENTLRLGNNLYIDANNKRYDIFEFIYGSNKQIQPYKLAREPRDSAIMFFRQMVSCVVNNQIDKQSAGKVCDDTDIIEMVPKMRSIIEHLYSCGASDARKYYINMIAHILAYDDQELLKKMMSVGSDVLPKIIDRDKALEMALFLLLREYEYALTAGNVYKIKYGNTFIYACQRCAGKYFYSLHIVRNYQKHKIQPFVNSPNISNVSMKQYIKKLVNYKYSQRNYLELYATVIPQGKDACNDISDFLANMVFRK